MTEHTKSKTSQCARQSANRPAPYTDSLPAVRSRLLRLVSHHCRYYAAGLVREDKAGALALKFACRKYQRVPPKTVPVHAVFLHLSAEGLFRFWLVTTQREWLDAYNEQVFDTQKKAERLTLAGLELKRFERKVWHRPKRHEKTLAQAKGKPKGWPEWHASWTWAFTRERMEQYRTLGTNYARRISPPDANRLLRELAYLPGYAGVRAQRLELAQAMQTARERQNPHRPGAACQPLVTPNQLARFINSLRPKDAGSWHAFHTAEEAGRKRPGGRLAGRASKPLRGSYTSAHVSRAGQPGKAIAGGVTRSKGPAGGIAPCTPSV